MERKSTNLPLRPVEGDPPVVFDGLAGCGGILEARNRDDNLKKFVLIDVPVRAFLWFPINSVF